MILIQRQYALINLLMFDFEYSLLFSLCSARRPWSRRRSCRWNWQTSEMSWVRASEKDFSTHPHTLMLKCLFILLRILSLSLSVICMTHAYKAYQGQVNCHPKAGVISFAAAPHSLERLSIREASAQAVTCQHIYHLRTAPEVVMFTWWLADYILTSISCYDLKCELLL